MKKNLLLRLCLLTAILLSIYSCRTEDQLEKNYRDNAGKFRVLVSKDGKPVNYAHGFKYLLERYDKLHGTAFTRKTAVQNYKLAGKGSSEFIEFNIHSQDLIRKNGAERWIMYPVIRNGDVSGIAIAILKEEETNLQLWRLDEKDPYYKEVITLFREQYKSSVLKISSGAMNKGGERCGFEGEEPCDIKEVVITVPGGGPKGDPKMYKPGSGTGGGYCQTYGNCYGQGGSEDDGGGGEGPPADTTKTPCEKTKAISTDPAVKAKVGTLKEQSKIEDGEPNYGEKAFEVKNDGTTSDIIIGEKHKVKLGSEAGKQGAYHNHTPDGIKMLSPPDILKMLNYALAQPNGNLSNGFLGMVGSEKCGTCPDGYKYHNYIIRFSGNSQELEKFIFQTNWDEDALEIDYNNKVREIKKNPLYINQDKKLNNTGLQKLFFDTLKNMKMEEKVTLQKIEDNGLVQNIILDNASNPSTIQCP